MAQPNDFLRTFALGGSMGMILMTAGCRGQRAHAHLKWAFSEALAHKLARAVYHLWKHGQVIDQEQFLRS